MKFLLPLLVASIVTLAISLSTPDPAPPAPPPARVACPRPATLRLRRFEDGSAWLSCAGRVLVRVSVPG
jgi:hypothetical protein